MKNRLALLFLLLNAIILPGARSAYSATVFDWKNYGAELVKELPADVQKGTELDKARYITAQVGKKLKEQGIATNMNRIDRGLLGQNAVGTCGDVSAKLETVLDGAGMTKHATLVSEKDMSLYNRAKRAAFDPFDVNETHGSVAIVINGKIYVSDLWVHGVTNQKNFDNAQKSEWNCMPLDEYQKRIIAAHYTTFMTADGDEASRSNTMAEALVKGGLLKKEIMLTRLAAGNVWQECMATGTYLVIKAKIDYPKAAGGAYCLEVEINGKRLTAALVNKNQRFALADKRKFSYFNYDLNAWMLFYSPDFSVVNTKAAGGYQVPQGSAYTYEWDLSRFLAPGDIAFTLKIRHNGKVADGKPITFMVTVND